MNILYLDCLSGISGNMFLGALVDMGLDMDIIQKNLDKLNLEGYRIEIIPTVKRGISCTYLDVEIDWDYFSPEKRKEYTYPEEIYKKIRESTLSDFVKENSLETFQRIIKAKSKIFKAPEKEIHSNSIEMIDSYVDIIGAAVAIEYLNPDKIHASAVHDGTGHFKSRHGIKIIPDPVVLEIFSQSKVPIHSTEIRGQLVTITGAAILSQFVEEFTGMNFSIEKIGYGCGRSDFEIPNVLRVIEGREVKRRSKFF